MKLPKLTEKYLILKCFHDETKPRQLISQVIGKKRAQATITYLSAMSLTETYFYIMEKV